MGLLWIDCEPEFRTLADAAFHCEQEGRADYFDRLSPRVRKIIRRDTRYNIDFLYTSYVLHDDKVMEDYACWLLQLMASVLPGRTWAQTADYVAEHFGYIRQALPQSVAPDRREELDRLLTLAQEAVRSAGPMEDAASQPPSRYEAEIQQYMESLFEKDSRRTMYLIRQFLQSGIPVNDIYVDILAEAMRRVGRLWHTARITVDAEHYCTSATQLAMTEMYPAIFSKARRGRKILCACPGGELHSMAARMVADLFENDGWDSVFLGAAVPEDAMLTAIRQDLPDLVALSVSMPQHLIECRSLVAAIKAEFPSVRIAVGGNAFRSTREIWTQWPVDYYTEDARQLLQLADRELCS